MKAAFYLLGLACLTTGLAASSFDFPQKEESDMEGFERIFHPDTAVDEQKVEELIITYPPNRPSSPPRPVPTTTHRTTYSTTRRPTTTPTPTTTTTTTTKPFPPAIRNPQIFKNILDIQGPLAGRLYNFVQNYQGVQDTRQKNDILYNLRVAKAVGRDLDEE